MIEQLELLDWRRRIFDVYGRIRLSSDVRQAWEHWRAVRDELFAAHPQSPLPEAKRAAFRHLTYFDYDERARVLADVKPAVLVPFDLATNRGSSYRFTRFGVASFELNGQPLALELYWLEGYSGGVFLPVGDTTNRKETYGAGRYLLDTAKGADLGTERDRLILDFNFAFNPSCAYDPQWVCPLPPVPNRLPVPIRAGERLPELPQGAARGAHGVRSNGA
jgi:uncharacterized protein (DUF1684 family)